MFSVPMFHGLSADQSIDVWYAIVKLQEMFLLTLVYWGAVALWRAR